MTPGVAALLQEALGEHRGGRLDAAENLYREVLRQRPGEADALRLLGAIAQARGEPEAAVALFREALAARPGFAFAQNDLGQALASLGRFDEAESAWRAAVASDPDFFEARANLGNRLAAQGEWAAAEMHYREAARLNPQDANAHNNLAAALYQQGSGEAAEHFRHAVALSPEFAAAHSNLGAALAQQNRHREAVSPLRRALALAPEDVGAHVNLALSLLALGEFAEGWREYEWRRKMTEGPRPSALPEWRGEPLAGRRILLLPEQGFGDAIHFMRYAPLVAARDGRAILEMPAELARLAASLDGVEEIVAAGGPEPECDFAAPLMSLPLVFGTALATIPGRVPYLAAAPQAVARWRARLAPLPGRKVGLVWAGSRRRDQPGAAAIDRRRSMRLADLAPLAGCRGVSFVSLQKDEPGREAQSPPCGMLVHDWTQELADFADTAALVAALDLVISVDTAVVHLAGALGKPVWVLSRHDGCWRWLLDRDDTPWYPSLRLFRQKRPGDWAEVVGRVASALSRRHPTEDRRT